jgi:hypothetical protein
VTLHQPARGAGSSYQIRLSVRPLISLGVQTEGINVVGSTSANRNSNRDSCVAASCLHVERSPFFEIALVFVRLDHVARFVVNANDGIMSGYETSRTRLHRPA